MVTVQLITGDFFDQFVHLRVIFLGIHQSFEFLHHFWVHDHPLWIKIHFLIFALFHFHGAHHLLDDLVLSHALLKHLIEHEIHLLVKIAALDHAQQLGTQVILHHFLIGHILDSVLLGLLHIGKWLLGGHHHPGHHSVCLSGYEHIC